MGIFKGEEHSEHVTQISGSVARDAAVQVLRDHDFVIKQDPYFISLETKDSGKGEVLLTEDVTGRKCGETKFYEVKDKVPERYAKLLPGAPTSTANYQVTDLQDGVFVYTQAALGIAVSREFVIREGGSGLELVERVNAAGSKLLLGTVREQNNETWRAIHTALVQKMGGSVASQN